MEAMAVEADQVGQHTMRTAGCFPAKNMEPSVQPKQGKEGSEKKAEEQ
jgi:hypothetical protein